MKGLIRGLLIFGGILVSFDVCGIVVCIFIFGDGRYNIGQFIYCVIVVMGLSVMIVLLGRDIIIEYNRYRKL